MNKSIQEHIETKMQNAWEKMGDAGNDTYEVCEESYWFGVYRTLEDVQDILAKAGVINE